jgi:hypothetical protein
MFQSEWTTQAEALRILGISRSSMHRLRAAGIIRDGIHTWRAGIGSRAPLRFNIPAIELALQVHTLAAHAGSAH